MGQSALNGGEGGAGGGAQQIICWEQLPFLVIPPKDRKTNWGLIPVKSLIPNLECDMKSGAELEAAHVSPAPESGAWCSGASGAAAAPG